MFYPNKSSILVSGEGNSSRSKMTSFMRILNLQRIVFLMCIVSSWEITCGTGNDKTAWKEKITVEKLGSDSEGKLDRSYKVVLLGDSQVGKTQILNKYGEKPFNTEYNSTVGFEFASHKYKSTINEGNKIIQLQIWETTGNETYRSIVQSFVKVAQAIVLVYDITKKESFDNIKKYWLGWAKDNAHEDAVYFLVGNKTDLEENERKVTQEDAEKFAKENNKMRFFEVSAMNSDKIDELFKDIVKERLIKEKDIIKAIKEYKLENNTNNNSILKEYKQKNNQKNDNNSNVNSEETAPPTPTKNKRCSCCPCNK